MNTVFLTLLGFTILVGILPSSLGVMYNENSLSKNIKELPKKSMKE